MSVSDGVDVHGNADTTIYDTIDVAVTVNDEDDPPRINGRTTYEVNEEGSRDVTTFVAEDQNRTSTQWTFSMTGTDSDDFSLSSGGALTFNEIPSYEDPVDANEDNHYQLTIQAEELETLPALQPSTSPSG